MLLSEVHRFIFISVPKTGSTSIEKFFRTRDSSIAYNQVICKGKVVKTNTHYTAREIKHIMGDEYDAYRKVAFIRHPYSKLVSAYFFYRNGKPITPGNKNPWPVKIRIVIARLLPFSLWALLYPFKSNRDHLCDENGRLLVDFIGRFEHMEVDFKAIFTRIGVDLLHDSLPHYNRSSHDRHDVYFKNRRFKYLIDLKLKHDLRFYDTIAGQAAALAGEQVAVPPA